MRRHTVAVRDKWQERVEGLGFGFHTMDGDTYWDESACYEFSESEIDLLEEVTGELYAMCLTLVDHVILHDLWDRLAIPRRFAPYISESWRRREPSLYGRFDFRYDGKGEPKLLEFNADTPTALFEASVVQYYWLQDLFPEKDQFNSIHEKLLAVMKARLAPLLSGDMLYFSCVPDHLEDLTTVEYLRDLAIQSGMATGQIFVPDIGYDPEAGRFVDLSDMPIKFMFKLYPWEWLIAEEFGVHLLHTSLRLIEPPWKMILSNKAMLPLLWEMYPGHKNLIPSFYDPPGGSDLYVEKPYFSREGEGIRVSRFHGKGEPQAIYQRYEELPELNGNYPVIGSWIVGRLPAGMGIREDRTPITNNTSRFVPHFF